MATKVIELVRLEITDEHGEKITKECNTWRYDYDASGISLYKVMQDFEAGEEEPETHLIARYNNISSFEVLDTDLPCRRCAGPAKKEKK